MSKYLVHLGTARVEFHFLHFPWDELRSCDKKNVERLRTIFKTEECLRDAAKNFIPALVNRQQLDAALEKSNISAELLLDNQGGSVPKLLFPVGSRLDCLDGQDRIEAARQFLPFEDRW